MTKARILADFISDGSPLADGTISVAEVTGAAPLASPTFTGGIGVTGTVVGSGNVILGTAETWEASYTAAQVKNTSLLHRSVDDGQILQNTWNTGGVWKKQDAGYAMRLGMSAGIWGLNVSNVGAGASDDVITWTEQLLVTSAGNVGIGTSSPSAKLDVAGPASITSFTGTTELGIVVQGSTGATDYSGIDFKGNSQVNPVARIGVLTTGGGSKLSFGTSNSYGSGITNTAMTIDPTGNVGIGTSSPVTFGANTHGLTLNGTAAGQHISFQQSDSYKGSLYQSGNTIILGSEIGEIQINGAAGVVINQSGADVDFRVESDTMTHALFVDGGTGKVGIFNGNPQATLVVGSVNAKHGITLNGGPNGVATCLEMIDGRSGAFSTLTIDVQLGGAGGYFYQVQVAGTAGCKFQTGGGYTNGTPNFSNSTATGAGFAVTSPSHNLIRFVAQSGVGTHPVAWIKIGQALNAAHAPDNVTFTWS